MRRALLPLSLALLAVFAPGAGAAPGDPVANFDYSPSGPFTHESVQFSSTSTAERGIVREEWDLDGDGAYDDAVGSSATWSFGMPGIATVRLRTIDTIGAYGVVTRYVLVGNRAPSASFSVFPSPASAGALTSFASTSFDPDSAISSYEWDLDGDGQFDDARGQTASRVFPTAGSYFIRLRVTDVHGASAVRMVSVPVGRAELMNPFPIVRIVGRVNRRGLRVRRLQVTVPVGARVSARCKGKGCRKKAVSLRSKPNAKRSLAVRIRSFERALRAGARITVRVTMPGVIGKYTYYRVRGKGKLPIRRDLCIEPGRSRAVTCPR